MPEIVDLFAMVSRMRVLNMPRSVACTDNVMRSIIETYFTPNRTVADLGSSPERTGIEPLKDCGRRAGS